MNRTRIRKGGARWLSHFYPSPDDVVRIPPKGWALCNGQLLPINQNQPLFSLLGTTFGGDGRVNFALPDFRGRVPIHVGAGHTNGERGGEQAHTLSIAELPMHVHTVNVNNAAGTSTTPLNNVLAKRVRTPTDRRRTSRDESGFDDRHRREPGTYQHAAVPDLSFCIAFQGIFPCRIEGGTKWHSLMSVNPDVRGQFRARGWFFCEGSCCRSRRTRRSSNDRHDYGGDGESTFACRTCADGCDDRATASSWPGRGPKRSP